MRGSHEARSGTKCGNTALRFGVCIILEVSTMPAVPMFLGNYVFWLGFAGVTLVYSFIRDKGDNERVVAGVAAAVGVLIYCFTKF